MKKIVLISILLATIAVPAAVAGQANARLALKKVVVYSVIANVVYWLMLLFLYPRLPP